MTSLIHKYTLKLSLVKQLKKIPKGAILLDIQTQGNETMMWFMFEKKNRFITNERGFVLIPTGEPFGSHEKLEYLRTVQMDTVMNDTSGLRPINFVWHIFEVLN